MTSSGRSLVPQSTRLDGGFRKDYRPQRLSVHWYFLSAGLMIGQIEQGSRSNPESTRSIELLQMRLVVNVKPF
jgi:hypothetical protein